MCHRISPLVIEELREALRAMQETGHARVPPREPGFVVPDVFPGKQLPLFVPDGRGGLDATSLVWGFDNPAREARSKLVFNTRIETAIGQARSGRGIWAEPIVRGRCLVPVRAFYELWTLSPTRRSTHVRFAYPGHQVFLLAAVRGAGRVSIMTTEPNASVAPYHVRMPLVLAPGESSIWLGENYASLANRSAIALSADPE